MIDIETFGLGGDAAIASIGMCSFYVQKEFEIVDEYYVNVNQKSNKEINRIYTKSTLDWWKEQDPEVAKALMVDPKPIGEAISGLYQLVSTKNIIWAHGISFDIPIIESSARAVGREFMPWNYRNLRCSRTLTESLKISAMIGRGKGRHNSLQDAIDQAKMVNEILFELEKL